VENSLNPSKKLPVTIIGAGAVGSALALALHKKHYVIGAVISKSGRSARLLGRKVRALQTGILPARVPVDGIIFIAVPDDEIKNVVQELSKRQNDFSGAVIFHTSGALSSGALKALKKKGAVVGSFHPLQTFPKINAVDLRRVTVAIEGDRKAVNCGKRIARKLGSRPFVLTSEEKVLYHIAAVFGSNYVVTLLSVVEELGRHIGVPQRNVVSMFEPLVLQSVKNVRNHSAALALTGPIARGDVHTIKRHRDVLKTKELKHISSLYSALAKATARLASKKRT
jgi:predicted short-subunit dehydrogenase-like oxidoreductase (DUF2520 family)